MPKKTYVVETDKGSYEIDVDEPRQLEASPLKEFGKTAVEAAKGYAEGLGPGIVKAVPRMVQGLGQEAVATLKGLANLVTDPATTATNVSEAIQSIPDSIKQQVGEWLDLARRDPEAFGKQVGDITGTTMAGAVTGRLLPLAPKPVARKLGEVMETVGKKGQWPIRMMGAHQLGSGNPLGIATMMTPEVLQAGGKSLIRIGGGVPAEEAALNEKFADAMSRRNVTAYDERARAQAAAAKQAENAARLSQIEQMAKEAGGTEQAPAIRRSVSADTPQGRMSATIRIGKPTSSAKGGAPTLEDAARAAGLDPSKIVSSQPGAQRGAVSMGTGRTIRIAPPTAPTGRPPVVPVGRAAQELAATPPSPSITPVEPTVTPQVKPGAGDVAQMEQELSTRLGQVPSSRAVAGPPVVPLTGPQEVQMGRMYTAARPTVAKMEGEGAFTGPRTTFPGGQPTTLEGQQAANLSDFMGKVDAAMAGAGSKSKATSGSWKNLSDNDAVVAANAYASGVRNPDDVIEAIINKRKARQSVHVDTYYANKRQAPED